MWWVCKPEMMGSKLWSYNSSAPEASRYIPSLKWENMGARDWEGTEGERLWRSQCCHAAWCLVPHQQPRKRRSLFPVICGTSFFLFPSYLVLFYSTPEKMGDVKRDGGASHIRSIPISLELSQTTWHQRNTEKIKSEWQGTVWWRGTQGESMR